MVMHFIRLMNMKKHICVVALLSVLMLVTSCTKAQDRDNLFDTSISYVGESIEQVSEERSQSIDVPEQGLSSDEAIITIEKGYQYGNMQKGLPSGDFADVGEKVVFLHRDGAGGRAYQIDKKTLEVLPFCNDATCLHDGGACKSYQIEANLEQYRGELYAAKLVIDETRPFYKIIKYDGVDFEPVLSEGVSGFFHANGALYVVSPDDALVRVNLDGTELQILIDEFDGHWCTVFGDYLYGSTWSEVFRVNLNSSDLKKEILATTPNGMVTDGEHLYYFDKDDKVIRLDMDGSNEVTVIEEGVPLVGFAFDEQNLYYRCLAGPGSYMEDGDCYSLYKMDKTTMESIKIAELPYCIMGIYTACDYDRIFVACQDRSVAPDEYEGYRYHYYAVSVDGTGYEELQLPNY